MMAAAVMMPVRVSMVVPAMVVPAMVVAMVMIVRVVSHWGLCLTDRALGQCARRLRTARLLPLREKVAAEG